jgi:putative ABC transport system permease protein
VLYPDVRDKFGYVILQADKGVNPSELGDKIEEKLRKYNNQKKGEENFYVQTYEDALATFGAILDVLNGILILIALISLIVAAVNIINTMYTTVLERTKEIGIMKSIGAQNHKILSIFVFEAGFLGLIGGVFGIFFGYVIAKIGGNIAIANNYSFLQPIFPMYLIVGCLLFSFFIGIVSGLWPARKASRLKPVDALRYE